LTLAGQTSGVAGARRDISRRPVGHARRENEARADFKTVIRAWARRAISAAS